jgi:hypothetical protein
VPPRHRGSFRKAVRRDGRRQFRDANRRSIDISRALRPPQLAASPHFSGTRFLLLEQTRLHTIAAMSQRMRNPPECDSCHAQMERSGKLPAVLTKRAVEVFVAMDATPLDQKSVSSFPGPDRNAATKTIR